MLDFRLQSFLAVCQYMNFTRAAAALNITQPAVSQHIHWLEDSYQTKLFDYYGKKLELTRAGQLLLTAATTLKHDDLHLRQQLAALQNGEASLVFGATLTIGEFVLPKVLAAYLKEQPQARLQMVVANTRELLGKIDSGEIDFAIVEGFFPKSEYDHVVYGQDAYIAVCGAAYPLPPNLQNVEQLLVQRLLVREPGSGTREVLENYLNGRNLTVNDFAGITEINNINVLKALVEAGCGVAFFYQSAVQAELVTGKLRQIALREFAICHDFSFVWRKNSIFAAEYQQLFSLLRL